MICVHAFILIVSVTGLHDLKVQSTVLFFSVCFAVDSVMCVFAHRKTAGLFVVFVPAFELEGSPRAR